MKHKQTLRRGLSVLLSLVLCLSLLPTTVLAEDAPVTSENAARFDLNGRPALALLTTGNREGTPDTNKAEWDSTTNTLTLKGVNFISTGSTAVELPAGAKIVLAEGTTNTITSTNSYLNQAISYGIYASGSLTIEGSGTLIVTGGAAENASHGIYLETGDLTINGGTVKATGGTSLMMCGIQTAGSATINGGTVTAIGGTSTVDGSGSYGILARGGLTINSGIVTATGSQATYSRGIGASNSQTVNINGGTVTATGGTAQSESYGIYANMGNITISGGHVTAQTVSTTGEKSALNVEPGLGGYTGYQWRTGATGAYTDAPYTYDADHTYVEFKDSGSTVTASAETADFTSDSTIDRALELLGGTEKATWSGTTLTLNGVNFTTSAATAVKLPDGATIVLANYTTNTITSTNPDTNTDMSYGIYAEGSLTIGGSGTLTVTGGAAGQGRGSAGICVTSYEVGESVVQGSLTISDSAIITATGGAAGGDSAGICVTGYGIGDSVVKDSLTISDSAIITATGGKANGCSYGIYLDTGLTIKGGTVTATGGKASSSSYGISAYGDITISGGTVTATSGEANFISCGIYTKGGVTISGGTVTATGGTATGDSSWSYGILAYVFMTIKGGTVTATCGEADTSCGIYSFSPITISKGHVTVRRLAGGVVLNMAPDLMYTDNSYYWWASGKSSFTFSKDEKYSHSSYAYVEFSDEHLYVFTAYGLYGGTMGIEPGETYIVTAAARDQVFAQIGIRDGYKLKDVTLVGIREDDLKWAGKDSEEYASRGFDFYMPENDVTVTVNWEKTGGSSSGGSGGSSPSYSVTVDKTVNGTVTVSPKSASKGSTVTLTVTPDKGYTLETLTVTDASGKEVKLTEKNGKCTFTMPAGKVTVEATFMEDNSMLNFFVDVPAGAYYYDAVLWAAENGITGGVDDTHFAPNAPCTRAQIVTFLWRAAGCPEPENVSSFADVPADSYYAKAVAWAVENGITTGSGDGTTFSPNATCTRAQAMTFLWRSQKSVAPDGVNSFTDVAADSYCADAVQWAVENGITNGSGDGTTFSPSSNCTRAQIVTFLFRCLGE